MSHTIFRLSTLILVIVANTAVLAQTSESNVLAESELANARALIQVGRKEIIHEELRLTKEEEPPSGRPMKSIVVKCLQFWTGMQS